MKLIIKDTINEQEGKFWTDFILELSANNIEFLSYPSYNFKIVIFLSEFFKAKVQYIYFYENDTIVGLCQGCLKDNVLYSLPVFSFSGIIAATDKVKRQCFEQLITVYHHFHIRDTLQYTVNFSSHKVGTVLKLYDSAEDQIAFYKSKLRSQISKSYQKGFKLCVVDIGGVDEFYSIYSRNMHRIGVPVLGKDFFTFLVNSYDREKIKIFLVELDNLIISAAITMEFGNCFEVSWASTIKKYNPTGVNMFMYNEMISYAIKRGNQFFSFGRSTINSSTYHFKKQWQGEFISIYYNYSSEINEARKMIKLLKIIYQLLPLSVALFISKNLRKRLINLT